MSLRSRLSGQSAVVWLPFRKIALSAGFAILLVVGVWYPVQAPTQQLATDSYSLDETVAELSAVDVDPADLANYLGVDSNADTTVVSLESEEVEETAINEDPVSTGEIIELNDNDLELLLADISDTEFF